MIMTSVYNTESFTDDRQTDGPAATAQQLSGNAVLFQRADHSSEI